MPVTGGGETPTWSPDGTQLAYTGNLDIYVVDVSGGERRRLTHDQYENYSPTWSPDGQWIAFVGGRGGGTIYAVRPDGSGRYEADGDGTYNGPAWSPDGTGIAYDAAGRGGRHDLFVMVAATGGRTRQLTRSIASETWAAWSPDGAEIVYTVDPRRRPLNPLNGDIYVVNAAGGRPRPLVRGKAHTFSPAWQPAQG